MLEPGGSLLAPGAGYPCPSLDHFLKDLSVKADCRATVHSGKAASNRKGCGKTLPIFFSVRGRRELTVIFNQLPRAWTAGMLTHQAP